jgi:hypothetical protein
MTLMLACGGCPFDGGWGCGSSNPDQTEASLYVTDAKTGQNISAVTFMQGDEPYSANCAGVDPASGDTACEPYVLTLNPGAYHLTVAAAGYRSTEVIIDTTSDKSAHLAVALSPAVADREIDPAGNTISANP